MRKARLGIQRSRTWSVEELSHFYVAHRSELVARAGRVLKDIHRAEEVAQDALVKFILAAPELEGPGHARAYLFRTVDNLCTDIFRQEGRRPNLVAIDASIEVETALQDHRDHADVIAAAEDSAIVRQAISLLSPAERAALIMWEIEGRSTKEIARELGIKESTVRHTLSRARASLRKILSNYVIDEKRGLTAVDLLSMTLRKVERITKDGSKVALSVFLLLFAYLGFTNLSPQTMTKQPLGAVPGTFSLDTKEQQLSKNSGSNNSRTSPKSSSAIKVGAPENNSVKVANAKVALLSFPGLDKNGLPIGFTITDSQGKSGVLYFNGKEPVVVDDGLVLSSIAKTASGAANLFLNQTVSQDVDGVIFEAQVSFGRAGNWIPVNSKVLSTEVERLTSGSYLLTAVIQVKSEVDSPISIPAFSAGRDLEVSPVRVVTRLLLNSSKTQVLGQAVLVVERSSK